jgi:hypothetical protein
VSNIRVDISSYDNFRRATFGKKYDTDGAFGYQCFDAADLLWRNISMLQRNGNSRLGRLRSSNGSAHGAWNGVIRTGENREAITPVNSNTYNARVGFDLITDVRKIKRGDVIVFGTGLGQHGHIGFADSDWNSSRIDCYSQNQGGSQTRAQFSVVSYASRHLIGAFRYREWSKTKTIYDALEVLKQIAGLPNTAPANSVIGDALGIIREITRNG